MSRAQVLRLDWSSPRASYNAQDDLADDQWSRLSAVWSKPRKTARLQKAFSQKRDAYPQLGNLVAMSNWRHADAFCDCGYRFDGKIFCCGHSKLCPSCSHHRKWNALCQFGLHFQPKQWQFLTISFKGGIHAEDLGCPPLSAYWNVARRSLELLQKLRLIRGSMWREELQVMSFRPLRLRPHLHALCHAAPLRSATVEELLRDGFSGDFDSLAAPLDVDCQGTSTAEWFCNRLSYINKAIDLVRPYREAGKRLGPGGDFTALNLEFEWFLRHFSSATYRRIQTGLSGDMHPLSSSYVGTPPDVFKYRARETPGHAEARDKHGRRIGALLASFKRLRDEEV